MWGTWADLDGRRMPVPSCQELELGTDWDWCWSRNVDAPTQRNHSTIWVEHEQREWGKVVSVSHKISSRVVANPQSKTNSKSRDYGLLQRSRTMAFIVMCAQFTNRCVCCSISQIKDGSTTPSRIGTVSEPGSSGDRIQHQQEPNARGVDEESVGGPECGVRFGDEPLRQQ